jgi:hypothetical protein
LLSALFLRKPFVLRFRNALGEQAFGNQLHQGLLLLGVRQVGRALGVDRRGVLGEDWGGRFVAHFFFLFFRFFLIENAGVLSTIA